VNKLLISIVGPTAVGKTRLAIETAIHFGTEIISCDSRQFFKEMPIGTAMPSCEERKMVTHHFIANLSVEDQYSIGKYEKEALSKIEELFLKYDKLILVGGSGMYEKAITYGLDDLPSANRENIEYLENLLKVEGICKLQKDLEKVDIEYYKTVDKQNPRRIIRALDVYMQTGKPYSEFLYRSQKRRFFDVIRIGIEAPRDILYQRINQRVDDMMKKGLLEEVKKLIPFREKTALKTVGYTELFKYFDGEWSLDFAINEIKKNSRRYAKRQLTWYRKSSDIHYVPMEYNLIDIVKMFDNKY